jgi:hypothetical protein
LIAKLTLFLKMVQFKISIAFILAVAAIVPIVARPASSSGQPPNSPTSKRSLLTEAIEKAKQLPQPGTASGTASPVQASSSTAGRNDRSDPTKVLTPSGEAAVKEADQRE